MLIGVDHGNKQIKTVHCEPFEAERHPSLWTECAEVSEYLLYAVY